MKIRQDLTRLMFMELATGQSEIPFISIFSPSASKAALPVKSFMLGEPTFFKTLKSRQIIDNRIGKILFGTLSLKNGISLLVNWHNVQSFGLCYAATLKLRFCI